MKWKRIKTGVVLKILACILGLGMLLHIWVIGMSFTVLGRTINDPRGMKTAWNNFGRIMLALQRVLVPEALYNALL